MPLLIDAPAKLSRSSMHAEGSIGLPPSVPGPILLGPKAPTPPPCIGPDAMSAVMAPAGSDDPRDIANTWYPSAPLNVTEQENAAKSISVETLKKGRSSSKYRGVSFHQRTGKWKAQIFTGGRQSYLGSFATEVSA